jgi:hypothetical protein
MHEHYHDQRFECATKKLKCDGYSGAYTDAVALPGSASRAECVNADKHN